MFSFCSSLGFSEHVVGISGASVWLRPPSIQTKLYSVKWKMQPHSSSSFVRILLWKNGSAPSYLEESSNLTLNHLKDRLTFTTENLTLLIKAAQPWDSGLYCLEITNDSGKIWKFEFQVSVFGKSQGQLTLPSDSSRACVSSIFLIRTSSSRSC